MRFLSLILGMLFSIITMFAQSNQYGELGIDTSIIDLIKLEEAYINKSNCYLIEKRASDFYLDSIINNTSAHYAVLNITDQKVFFNSAFEVFLKSVIDSSLIVHFDSSGLFIDGDSIANNRLHVIDTFKLSDTLKDLLRVYETFNNKSTSKSIPYQISPNGLDQKVIYKSNDSIVFNIENQQAVIFGDANVDYEDIKLKSGQISIDWQTNRMHAKGIRDSNGIMLSEPIFEDGDQTIYAKKIIYNYQTQKGDIYNLYTVQGEGYFQGEKVRKQPNDEMLLKNGRYTTCPCQKDEEPEFYLNMSRVKIIPDKVIVAGPSNLVLKGIPTPLFIPFGIFPITSGRATGLIIPQYGNSQGFGYYLKEHSSGG